MALNATQIAGLNDLNKKIATGYNPTATDTANLNYAKQQGYTYQAPTAPTAVPTGATKILNPAGLQGLNESQLFRQGKDIYKLPEVPKTITSDQLGGATPVVPAVETPQSQADALVSATQPTQAGLQALLTQTLTPSASEAKISPITSQINDLTGQLANKPADYQAELDKYGFKTNVQDLQNLNTQIASVKNAYDQYSVGLEGRVASAGSIYGRQALAQRQAAVELGGLSSIAQALQGNVNLAMSIADKTIDIKYEPIQNEIDNQKFQLDQVYSQLSREEQRKADALKITLDARQSNLDEQKQTASDINQLMVATAQNGADSNTLQKISNSKDYATAIINAGSYLTTAPKPPTLSEQLSLYQTGLTLDANGHIIPLPQDVSNASADQIANAIKQVESNGNYDAKGASGENGAYQFMPATWTSWSSQYAADVLGQSTAKLPMTPENQDAVAKWKIQQWLDQGYTPDQIASLWNSGSPEYQGKVGVNSKGVAYNVPNYVSKVTGALVNTSNQTSQYSDFLSTRTPEQVSAFNSIPEADKSSVVQLINGDALLTDLVKSRGIQGTEAINKLINEATKVDPTFSVNQNKVRYNFINNWNNPNGASSKVRNAINTALGHLTEFKIASDNLDPTNIKKLNSVKNILYTQTGDPAILQLRATINALSSEVATIYKGGTQPSEKEITSWEEILAADFSKQQFTGIANQIGQLLSSKISATAYQYESTMGKPLDVSLIDPEKRQALIDVGLDPNSIAPDTSTQSQSSQAPYQATYNGKLYNVDAQGNMTEANQSNSVFNFTGYNK